MRVKPTIRLALLALLIGCTAAHAGGTRVVQTGPDTYIVASHGVKGWSSASTQKVKAMERAAAHCEKLGKGIEVINSNALRGGFARQASADVEFRCVTPAQ
jgi:hypothetical protein